MNKIKELTAHIRRLAEKGYIVDYNTPNELNNALNQIDIASESQHPTLTWTQIISEDDLPKDDGYYWVINSFDDIFIEDFNPKDIIDRDIWLNNRTDYQPIPKPKPKPPNKLH